MQDLNLPIMLTYRCPAQRAVKLRTLLESHRSTGVCFEERSPSWWARLLGGGTTFTIRYPAFFSEELQFHLSPQRWGRASAAG